jgi:UDP-3-O-[3-hydroxymyristoyl] N-acetylglucosamine deacetylase
MRAGHAMHTALVSRLLKDRSAWELVCASAEPVAAKPEKSVLGNPALVGA